MGEIFRMQISQILGGRRRWLVAIALLLPVLLSLAVVTKGGFSKLDQNWQNQQIVRRVARGELPAGLELVRWEGQDLAFANDCVKLTREGPLFFDQPFDSTRYLAEIHGRLVILKGQLWIDPAWRETIEPGVLYDGWLEDPEDASVNTEPPSARTVYAIYLFLLYPQVICLLLALLYGTAVLGHELDGKTLPYLFTRPLPRWRFVLGKYFGIVTALTIPTAISLSASWALITGFKDLGLLAGLLAGTLGALLAYNAVFILFGFLAPRRAMIVALLYGVVFELVLSFVPALINQITVTYYLRSLVAKLLDLELPRDLARSVGGADLQPALIALTIITGLALCISSLLAAHREYVVKDEA